MPVAARSSASEGVTAMTATSQHVIHSASGFYHSLCGARPFTSCDKPEVDDSDKNGGPNHLQAWRTFRGMTQAELAEKVGTNQNMIGYLESGERGLSAKWLRRLAPALKTRPGMLLDHDPADLDADVLEIWATAEPREKRQIADVARAIVRTGTSD
jgi:transcriptional regulator with XRE-family HTH domain